MFYHVSATYGSKMVAVLSHPSQLLIQRKTINMPKQLILIGLVIFLIPSTLFALDEIKTGYDIYHNIKLIDNPASPDTMIAASITVGYLKGYLDGLRVMQRAQCQEL